MPTKRPTPRPTYPATAAPSPLPTASPTTETPAPSLVPSPAPTDACSVIAGAATADLLKDSYTSSEDAYDSDSHGHATYECAETLIEDLQQYDKAEYYLWCVVGHCEDCPGAGCPTTYLDSEAECESATYNYLGFVNRKKSVPDYDHAETYYTKSLALWPENCGAMNYLTELYITVGNATAAEATFSDLCDVCGPTHENTLALVDDMGPCVTVPPTITPTTSAAPTAAPSEPLPPDVNAASRRGGASLLVAALGFLL